MHDQLRGFLLGALILVSHGCDSSESRIITGTERHVVGDRSISMDFYRIVDENEKCDDCSLITFANAVTDGDAIRIPRLPELSVAASGIEGVQSVRFLSRNRGRIVWKARITFAPDTIARMRDFNTRTGNPSDPILVGLGGQPLEILTRQEVLSSILVGAFDSEEELTSALGMTPSGRLEVNDIRLGDRDVPADEFAKAMERSTLLIERHRKSRETLEELEQALTRGDEDHARQLIDRLKEE